jgi:tRNA (mo5U34)-methyltransferase
MAGKLRLRALQGTGMWLAAEQLRQEGAPGRRHRQREVRVQRRRQDEDGAQAGAAICGSAVDRSTLEREIAALGPWFHDLDLRGVRTAPDNPLRHVIHELWALVHTALPDDLRGKSVLDIGCNAGFYSLQLHRRGAEVTGVDHNPRYIEQARFAAAMLGADIEYAVLDVYDLDDLGRQFDYVLFMGVLYHLRHPLYALEKVAGLVRERLVFQSMLRGPEQVFPSAHDYPIEERDVFLEPGFPAMYFIEGRYAGDPTNWWIPNLAGIEAMLRCSGLKIDRRVGSELFICSPGSISGVTRS